MPCCVTYFFSYQIYEDESTSMKAIPEFIVPKLNLLPRLSEHAEESFSSSTPLRPPILRSMGLSKALNSSCMKMELLV